MVSVARLRVQKTSFRMRLDTATTFDALVGRLVLLYLLDSSAALRRPFATSAAGRDHCVSGIRQIAVLAGACGRTVAANQALVARRIRRGSPPAQAFDMRGGRKGAKPSCGHPFDGRAWRKGDQCAAKTT